jgi:hypothetical protein
MSDHNNQNPVAERTALLCVGCGRPIKKGDFCAECVDRGVAPCAGCEGLSLADVEEGEL